MYIKWLTDILAKNLKMMKKIGKNLFLWTVTTHSTKMEINSILKHEKLKISFKVWAMDLLHLKKKGRRPTCERYFLESMSSYLNEKCVKDKSDDKRHWSVNNLDERN